MEPGTDLEGQRARVTVDGVERAGTVTAVTYTPKKGNAVARLELDEAGPDGRETVAVGVEELERV